MATAIAPDVSESEVGQHNDNVQVLTQRLTAIDRAATDAVIDTRALTFEVSAGHHLSGFAKDWHVTDNVTLFANMGGGDRIGLRVLEGAHHQIAERLGIPKLFYTKLLEKHPDLIATLATQLMLREPSKRMLRMLAPMSDADGRYHNGAGTRFNVRAIVSEKFKPMDNHGLLDLLTPEAITRGLLLREWAITDTRFYAKFSGPERTIEDVRQSMGVATIPGAGWLNEVLSYGAVIQNSETGHGALGVSPYMRVLRCLNGYCQTNKLRITHVGGKAETDNEGWISQGTKELGAAHAYAQIRDGFIDAVSEATQQKAVTAISSAMGEEIKLPEEVPVLQFIGNVGRRFEFSDKEIEVLQREVTEERVASGSGFTRFALAQGVTATARDANPERKVELETVGWKIIESTAAELVRSATAAVKANARHN